MPFTFHICMAVFVVKWLANITTTAVLFLMFLNDKKVV
jgi:hypothetical protein